MSWEARLLDQATTAPRRDVAPVPHVATVTAVDGGALTLDFGNGVTGTTSDKQVLAVAGDVVEVVVQGRRMVVTANYTHPVTDDTKAGEALDAAGAAQSAAIAAQGSATAAATAASSAQSSADAAATAAATADGKAAAAAQAAATADGKAVAAQQSAARANTAASDALRQLDVVEGVLDTVTWIAEHGKYVPAEDQVVIENKAYYQLVSGQYVIVESPTDANLSSYYELVASESLTNYVASHLALTDAGLWLLGDPGYTYEPTQDVAIDALKTYYTRSGSGTEQDPYVYAPVASPDVADIATYYEYLPTDPGYRTLIARDGFSVIDPNGRYVSTFGESITFDSEREQRIGGENAYMAWRDTDNDGVADSLSIVADSISFRGDDGGDTVGVMKVGDTAQLEETVAGIGESVDTLNGYIEVLPSSATIVLGKRDGDTKAALSNSALEFSYTNEGGDTNVAASIGVGSDGSGALLINRAEISDGGWLRLGSWQWVPRANGNVALKWVGE